MLTPASAYPVRLFRDGGPFHGLVGFSECFPGQCHPAANGVIFRPTGLAGLPLLSFSLFSTYQLKETRPGREPGCRSLPPIDVTASAYGVSSYPHGVFSSLQAYATLFQVTSAREVFASAF